MSKVRPLTTTNVSSMAIPAIPGGEPVRPEPWLAWPYDGPEVQEAIRRVAESHVYHPQFGEETAAFEKAHAAYHGVPHAVPEAIGDRVNLEIRVQPTSGETEMRQTTDAIRKLSSYRETLRQVEGKITKEIPR